MDTGLSAEQNSNEISDIKRLTADQINGSGDETAKNDLHPSSTTASTDGKKSSIPITSKDKEPTKAELVKMIPEETSRTVLQVGLLSYFCF